MPKQPGDNNFGTTSSFQFEGKSFKIARIGALEGVERLPFSLRVMLENLVRREDGSCVAKKDIEALLSFGCGKKPAKEISFMPARVLLQDFTGVPLLVDLAAMRECIFRVGADPAMINPVRPADLVIDHSVQVDFSASPDAFRKNAELEFERNAERYRFLKWGSNAFRHFRVVPPQTGIIHQVNLEYLAPVVFSEIWNGENWLYPDTLLGADSHTTMINGLGVVGWGVGGIEAEAVMLGESVSMLIPDVIGVKLSGKLREPATATDLVLTITEMLRKKGVVGKFVEFYGPGLQALTLPDRATVANMAPEYGATVGFFPVDRETLVYLRLSGREESHVRLIEAYCKEQGLFRTESSPEPVFSETLELDLASVEPSLAGPKRPQDRVPLARVKTSFRECFPSAVPPPEAPEQKFAQHGSVVIASITSCTNTSNPAVMLGAGLLAKKAVERGLAVKPWVKTSFAPGSKVVMDYLAEARLVEPLEKLGFHLVGYGCATCIGNSGPLPEDVAKAVQDKKLVVASVLSGNRNFEGRIHSLVRANYLASPALVVAYAIAGRVDLDLEKEPLGRDAAGRDVYLRDIWPAQDEIAQAMKRLSRGMFRREYGQVFEGDSFWKSIEIKSGTTFPWDNASTYVKEPPYFSQFAKEPAPAADILGARVLALLGDSVTTDHISPAGAIGMDSPAGKYLIEKGIAPKDFNSYGARRGNHEVMMRGTFANVRLKNLLVPGSEGGVTLHAPSGANMSIYDAAVKYQKETTPLLVIAGKEYGSGSSRDWAAKGPALLGVKAVLAESFERIHRSNLIGMGILPLQFEPNGSWKNLGLRGQETFDVTGLNRLAPGQTLTIHARSGDSGKSFRAICRIDTPAELAYFQHGGILPYVLRKLISGNKCY